MLYVDRACNPKGSTVVITLEGLEDISLEQSLRFHFKTSTIKMNMRIFHLDEVYTELSSERSVACR